MMELFTYAAPCACARAARSRLLTSEDWQHLLAAPRAADVVSWLGQRGLVSSSAVRIREVEKELRGANIRSTARILRFAHGRLREALSFLIHYFDLLNLQTVICHLGAAQTDRDLLPYLYDTRPFGLLNTDQLRAATSFPMLTAALNGVPRFGTFRASLAAYEEDADLRCFVTSLETEFMRDWERAVRRCAAPSRRGFGDVFGAFLTLRAVGGAMRGRYGGGKARPEARAWARLLPGSRSSADPAEPLSSDDPAVAWGRLTAEALPKRLAATAPSEAFALAGMHRAMGGLLQTVTRDAQRGARFDANFLISFQFTQMIESENLISLLECKDLGVGRGVLTDYLVGVE